jgi:2-dehydro-3-deoxygluconokinase
MSIVCFGELMLRLTPAIKGEKLVNTSNFDVNYAGSESNVASSLAVLGDSASFVSKLPLNPIGEGAIQSLNKYGINTEYVHRGGQRIGSYFIEMGSSIRPGNVVYDRAGSAIADINEGEFDWEKILRGKKWFFVSGITPALSDQCAKETLLAVKTAKREGVSVSFDMNYRRKLWSDRSIAAKIFNKIMEYTDLLFGNEGVLADVYDIHTIRRSKEVSPLDAIEKAKNIFGTLQFIFTSREHISASNNRLHAAYSSKKGLFTSKSYEVEILDRLGTGDAFAAGCLHGLIKGWKEQKIIDFGTAAFALKHTIRGDQHISNEDEILSIMDGNISGHIQR